MNIYHNKMNTSKLKNVALFIILAVFSCQIAMAQHIFKGKVIDSITREPLDYACVYNGGKCHCTDKDGHFQFSLSSDTTKLTITYIGYTTKIVPVKSSGKLLVINLARGPIDLKEVIISPSLIANAFHTLSTLDLNLRPVNSSQDLMRLVPGLFIAQHMGGGKAEQIFIRGFDADHGTDLNVSVDGMPVNMVSHIHGQGYADLHFLIPETVSTYDFGKGPYLYRKG